VSLPETSAAIVAGGEARRFGGQDKSRLVVRGRPIIVRQLAVLQQVAREIFVVAPDASRYSDLGLTVHPDAIPGSGALGGLYTAVDKAACDTVLVVAADQPFLSAPLLCRLVELSAGHDGAWVATEAGVEPLLACYRRSARHRIRERIETGRLRASDLAGVLDMAAVSGADLASYGPPEELLANLNTPEDLARVQ
jgi:molybdopterin-guanine dinucleotide biosynthesis protein A